MEQPAPAASIATRIHGKAASANGSKPLALSVSLLLAQMRSATMLALWSLSGGKQTWGGLPIAVANDPIWTSAILKKKQRRAIPAGKPGHPSKERAAQMAKHHEIMAKMIEARFWLTAPAFIGTRRP